MENRYNIDLVEKFRKGEIILEFPKETKTKQDVEDLQFLTDKNRSGGFPYYEAKNYYNEIPKYSSRLPIVPLSQFINNQVDVVVNTTTKDGLEKIVADNLKDTIEMIESFNYEVRKLAEGEIRRGTKVWCRDSEGNKWYEKKYLFQENELELSHCVLSGNMIQWYRFATTTDPNSIKQIKRSDILEKFDCDKFEIID